MTTTDPPPLANLLDLVPHPSEIQSRLAEVARARRVLRRQLKLSLDARRTLAGEEPAVASVAPGKAVPRG